MTKEELLEFKYTYGYFKIDDLTYGYMTILFFQPPCRLRQNLLLLVAGDHDVKD